MTMLLEAQSVTKRFGRTQALRDGSLEVREGEIHGLLGQNGAGKSTLVKILAGVYQRDEGTIRIGGAEMDQHIHPRDAREAGLSFIHQDLGLIEEMTVADNVALSLGFPAKAGIVNGAKVRAQASEQLDRLGVDIDPKVDVGRLNGADQALVAIARAVVEGARLVVLDEPTARLRGSEVDRLFNQLDVLRRSSVGFIYVTHRLEEVFTLTDRVTVFRNGDTVGTEATKDLTEDQLISMIIGSQWSAELAAGTGPSTRRQGKVAVRMSDVATAEMDSVDIEIDEGEVVGITGPAGSGTSIAQVLSGDVPALGGDVSILGEGAPRSPREAIGREIACVPSDRRALGLAVEASIAENLAWGHYAQSREGRSTVRGWLRPVTPRSERKLAAELIERFGIRADTGDSLVSELSGGNQQKVLLAKWLQDPPRLLILDEPTQGVDIGTRHEIYGMIEELSRAGVPQLVVSADFAELDELCDRVAVIRGRRIGTVLEGDDVTHDRIAAESYRATAAVSAVTELEGSGA